MFSRRALSTAASATYDMVVLGGGSGGIASARRAAAHGARVALVDPSPLGGTCVNMGCVPKKIMYNAAEVRNAMLSAPLYGIHCQPPPPVDWETLVKHRDAYVHRLNNIYERNLENSHVEHLHGWGKLVDGADGVEVAVSGGKAGELRLSAPHVLVATGARPRSPSFPGADLVATSDDFFTLPSLPKRSCIIGGGYIATELAGILDALGSEVTMLVRGPRLLRTFDVGAATMVQESMEEGGVRVETGVEMKSVTKTATGLAVRALCGEEERVEEELEVDVVVAALGRDANSGGLGLEEVGVAMDAKGRVRVNEWQETKRDGVLALGDVCNDSYQLTPVAIAAGRLLADRLFGGREKARLDYSNIPTVVFSHPPLGTVGLGEEVAVKQGYNVKTYQGRFTSMFYGLLPPDQKVHSLVKLVCDQNDNDRLLGVHIVDPAAPEILQGFAVALKMGATKADLDATVAIHPTSAEELVTLQPWTPKKAPWELE